MDILEFIGLYRNEVAATHLHYIHSRKGTIIYANCTYKCTIKFITKENK